VAKSHLAPSLPPHTKSYYMDEPFVPLDFSLLSGFETRIWQEELPFPLPRHRKSPSPSTLRPSNPMLPFPPRVNNRLQLFPSFHSRRDFPYDGESPERRFRPESNVFSPADTGEENICVFFSLFPFVFHRDVSMPAFLPSLISLPLVVLLREI